MGTSTSQRSPATPEWEFVREGYRHGLRDPAEISRRIASALSADTRAEMSGAGVAMCLDTLLGGTRAAAQSPPGAPLQQAGSVIDGASRLRIEAERRVAAAGHASRFTDLALDAIGAATLTCAFTHEPPEDVAAMAALPVAALGASYTDGRLHQVADCFISEDLDRCLRYFVTRDLSGFVGTDACADVRQARELAASVGNYTRQAYQKVQAGAYENSLQDSLREESEQRRMTMVREVLGNLLRDGLTVLEAPASSSVPRSRRAARPPNSEAGSDEADDSSTGLRLLASEDREAGVEYLPVYSLQAAAGYFGFGEDVTELGYVAAPPGLSTTDGMFVATIAGRSMEPRLPDGSLAVFRAPLVGSRQGKIVLAQKRGFSDPDTGGSYTVKKYESVKAVTGDAWEHVAIRLVPINREYEPIEVLAQEAEDLVIVAEFVRLIDR